MPALLVSLALLTQSLATEPSASRSRHDGRLRALRDVRPSCTTSASWPGCGIPGSRPSGSARTTGRAGITTGSRDLLEDPRGRRRLGARRAAGPGIVQRIWFTHTSGEKPGLLDGKNEHIKIYLDGRATPALDIPLEQLFSGKHPHFPSPLVIEGSGGFVSYVPIPFRDGCKIVVEGRGVRFYQINLAKAPGGRGITSFAEQPGRAGEGVARPSRPGLGRPGRLRGARARGGRPGEVRGRRPRPQRPSLSPSGPVRRPYGRSRSAPPRGPKTRGERPGCGSSGITTRLADAGVDLPLGYAFGAVEGADAYQSLLVGQRAGAWYNRFPMPYRRQAILRIDTSRPLKGTIVVRTTRGHRSRRRRISARPSASRCRPGPRRTSAGSRKKAGGISPASSSSPRARRSSRSGSRATTGSRSTAGWRSTARGPRTTSTAAGMRSRAGSIGPPPTRSTVSRSIASAATGGRPPPIAGTWPTPCRSRDRSRPASNTEARTTSRPTIAPPSSGTPSGQARGRPLF